MSCGKLSMFERSTLMGCLWAQLLHVQRRKCNANFLTCYGLIKTMIFVFFSQPYQDNLAPSSCRILRPMSNLGRGSGKGKAVRQ
jgi:hypothetical protein